MKFDISSGAAHILQTLADAGHEAWLVGGCVRDLLRGVAPHDWDICTSARPEQTGDCFAGHKVVETGLKHGTVTVLEGGEPYEITSYRAEGPYSDGRRPDFVRFVPDLKEDLARRDFTMNAIALGLDGTLQDPFGGAEDIRNRLIRCVGEPVRRFQEDGLRVMRALRFAAVLGYHIEERTAQAVHGSCAMLKRVAAERIHVELAKLLAGPAAGGVLRQYPDVLCVFWPQLGPLAEMEQNNPWGWEHTVRAVEAAPAELTLRLAMLLHDAGKPSCRPTGGQGIGHFYGHPGAGADMADQMLRTLKFENAVRRRVVTLVEHHDAPLALQDKAVRRWLGRLGPEAFFQLLEVKRADILGQNPQRRGNRLEELAELRARAERITAEGQCLTLKGLAVNGQDVIAVGGRPGPEVGRVLKALLDRVLDGEAPNEREALLELARREVQGNG